MDRLQALEAYSKHTAEAGYTREEALLLLRGFADGWDHMTREVVDLSRALADGLERQELDATCVPLDLAGLANKARLDAQELRPKPTAEELLEARDEVDEPRTG